LADYVVVNKIDSATPASVKAVKENIKKANPKAGIIEANSKLSVDKPELIKGKRVLVVEDGPTLTHGEMKIGAGMVAAQRFGATAIIDPRDKAVGKIAETFKTYPNIGTLLPAMGYGEQQMKDLAATIDKVDCDAVVIATPIDLQRVVKINKPCVKVGYDLDEIGKPDLEEALIKILKAIS
jgi:predicted GTPase